MMLQMKSLQLYCSIYWTKYNIQIFFYFNINLFIRSYPWRRENCKRNCNFITCNVFRIFTGII